MGYIGVKKKNKRGKNYIYSSIVIGKKNISLGGFKTQKEAARAYDMYILKNNLNKKTNFNWKKVKK